MPGLQATDYEKVRSAGEGLNCFRALDEQFPSLEDKLGLIPGVVKGSGQGEVDYPDLAQRGLSLNFFTCKRKCPVPAHVLDLQKNMVSHSLYGIFPEVKRAWVTVDSDIILWRYEDGRDLSGFYRLKETIFCVGIVEPPTGAFKNEIKALLVIATASKIEIYSMAFNPSCEEGLTDKLGVLQISDEIVTELPTDGVLFDVIHGTKSGRLFLGGRDGNLYEVQYIKKQRWGGGSKINHSSSALSYFVPGFLSSGFLSRPDPISVIESDRTRNMLYTLSAKGTVTAYHMGETGDGLQKIGTLSDEQILKAVMDSCGMGAVERQHIGHLVALTPLETYETGVLHAVGTTDTGIRVYLTCTPDFNPQLRQAYDLKIAHVRLPPGFAANSGPQRPKQVSKSICRRGVTMFTSNQGPQWQGEQNDVLWMLSGELLAGSYMMSECFESHQMDGSVRGLVEERVDEWEGFCYDGRPLPSSYVLLHMIKPRVFTVLTTTEIVVLEALRPLDQLEALLASNQIGLKAFFDLVRPEQACVLGLALACGAGRKHRVGRDPGLADLATRAVMAYGTHAGAAAAAAAAAGAGGGAGGMRAGPVAGLMQQVQFQGSPLRMTPHQMQQSPIHPGVPYGQMMGQQQQQQFMQGGGGFASSPGFGMRQPGPGPITSTPFAGSLAAAQQQIQSLAASPTPGIIPGALFVEYRASFSSLHNALYTYLWRLCRPIISNRLTQEFVGVDKKTYLSSAITDWDASYVIEELTSFLAFLRTKCDLLKGAGSAPLSRPSMGGPGSVGVGGDSGFGTPYGGGGGMPRGGGYASPMLQSPSGQVVGSYHQSTSAAAGIPLQHFDVGDLTMEIRRLERTSIDCLESLVDRMVQVLELWRLLSNHPFHAFVAECSEPTKLFLRNAQFLELVIDGQPALGNLISVLINKYLTDSISVEGICHRLRQICPRVYKEEDAKCAKANELMSAARSNVNRVEKMRLIDEVMAVCKDVAGHVNLVEMGGELASCGAFRQLVTLCSAAGKQYDPNNLSVRCYRNPASHDHVDSLARDLYVKRLELCRPVTGALYDLLVQGKEIPTSPGAFSLLVARNTLLAADVKHRWAESEEQARQFADEILAGVVDTDDEILHVAVFSFLVEAGLNNVLIELKSPYLESFLAQEAQKAGAPRSVLDNLWKLHERKGGLEQAGAILERMAEKRGGELSLDERIVYYGRALGCLKASSCPDSRKAEEVGRVGDKLDVARVQKRILQAIGEKPDMTPAAKRLCENELNQELFSLAELHQKFVDPNNLWDCHLAVAMCGDYADPQFIAQKWARIIDEDLQSTVHKDPVFRVTQVRAKIERYAKEFGRKPEFFPAEFLVEHLETKSCQEAFDRDPDISVAWVWQLMESCGVGKERLVDVYDSLYRRKDNRWVQMDRPFHLVRAAASLLFCVAKEFSRGHNYTRMPLKVKALDLISSYYLDLQLMGDTRTRELEPIRSELKNAQDLLESRLVF